MSDASPILVSDHHRAFVEKLVESGQYESARDVLENALDLLREQVEEAPVERDELRRVLLERMNGEFISCEEMDERLEIMIDRRRRAYGL